MAKKVEKIVSDLKKLVAQDKLVIGTERTFKLLRDKGVKHVYCSSNCSPNTVERVKHLSGLSGISVEQLDKSSSELGTICRKPFSIAVIGVLE